MKERKLDKKFILWGIESVGEGWISIVSSTYLAMFMTDIALIPLALVSGAMFIMSISDLILASSAGAIISMLRAGKWGRLRSYLLIAPPFAVVFYIMHFISIPNRALLSAIIITIGFVAARVFHNLTYAANISLINVIAKDQDDKNRLSSQRMIGSNAGRMLGNYLTPTIVVVFASTFGERTLYPLIMIGAGIIYIATNLVHFSLSKGFETASSNSEVTNDCDKLSIKAVFLILSRNPQLLVTMIIDLSSNVAALVLPSIAVYYYKYVAARPDLTALHMLTIGLAGMAGSMLVRAIGPKVKDPRKFLLVAYPFIALFLFCTRFVAGSPYFFMAFNVLVHGITGTTQTFELSLYMDNVTYTKYKTGKDANALIMGISGVTVKIASVIKSVMIPFVLMSSGYVAGRVTEQAKASIVNAYSIIPSIIPLIGFFLLKFCYKLTKEKMEAIRAASKTT